MQLINFIQVALLATARVIAIPIADIESITPSSTTDLFKRADPAPVSCGPDENKRAWPLQSVQDAFQGLQQYGIVGDDKKPKAGTRVYPRQVGQGSKAPRDPALQAALDAIPECATSNAGSYKWFEFPITDPTFAGCPDQGCQGPDRVIAISQNIGPGGTRTFTYCLAVTHRGQNGGDFGVCANAP